jgi:chemotaxis protein methyltransferase CheR
VFYEENPHTTLLLGIEDVTERRALEREREDLLRQKDALLREKEVLLEELQHRVANSLQIIAAIILMKSQSVESEETRLHLQDAHNRVMSVAAVQRHLHVSGAAGPVNGGQDRYRMRRRVSPLPGLTVGVVTDRV